MSTAELTAEQQARMDQAKAWLAAIESDREAEQKAREEREERERKAAEAREKRLAKERAETYIREASEAVIASMANGETVEPLSVDALADETGFTPAQVEYRLKQFRVPDFAIARDGAVGGFSPEMVPALEAWYALTFSVFGRKPATVNQWLYKISDGSLKAEGYNGRDADPAAFRARMAQAAKDLDPKAVEAFRKVIERVA